MKGYSMSLAFKERFRDRMGAVGRQGELEDPNLLPKHQSQPPIHTSPLPFARPLHLHQSQASQHSFPPVKPPVQPAVPAAHSTIMFGTPLKGSLSESVPLRKPPLAARTNTPNSHRNDLRKSSDILKKAIEKPVFFAAKANNTEKKARSEPRSQAGFSPYTLEDYRLIRPTKYSPLGGLGASIVGSPEWLRKKELDSRKKTYGLQVFAANRTQTHFSSRHSDHQDSPFADSSRQRALQFSRSVHPPSPKFARVSVFIDRHM
jgi:hypothetical protein